MAGEIAAASRPDVKSLAATELAAAFREWGEPAYRLRQLLDGLYRRRATEWGQLTDLPRRLRERLAERFTLQPLALERLQSEPDGATKFLWRLPDGEHIESVLLPANPALYGEGSDRRTLCVSTQVGCGFGCRFCASGLGGLRRNLLPFEIVEQVLAAERWRADQTAEPRPGRLIDNLVIMGMGEPFANYERVLAALRILNAPWGGSIGARRITVSTCGLPHQIRRFAQEPEQFRLAISLHGAADAVRSRIMPVNKRYPLAELLEACREYRRRKGKLLTLEYILIRGVNDAPDQAARLARIARELRAKVNLIPYNPVPGLAWERPEPDRQKAFLHRIRAAGAAATLRREKGASIQAACGQLRLRAETEP
ncbi:MAG: 23S rRNA (adenine(2503)-C(2))-methyltransferase RlmN [Verrucomicrobia bacterium]|nr:23S rRNA (adenine(2503)-C(2))-methyltransferase RlmN [Verrucomicrobiota bacterium]